METRDNKYLKWYWNICESAKTRVKPEGYTEKHHIYPKSIYGKNIDLVILTAKEHYIVHLCLWLGLRQKYGTQDIRTRKMANGFHMMNRQTKKLEGRYFSSSRFVFLRIACNEFRKGTKHTEITKLKISKANRGLKRTEEYCEWLSKTRKGNKRELSDEMKKIVSEKLSGENHWNYGKHWSDEVKDKLRAKAIGKIPTPETRQKISIANSREKNPMYGRCAYDIWLEKYGKEEADRRFDIAKNKMSLASKGKGKSIETKQKMKKPKSIEHRLNMSLAKLKGYYPKWVEEFGVDVADKKREDYIVRAKEKFKI